MMRSLRAAALAALAAAVVAAAAAGAEFELSLDIDEFQGAGGTKYISSGVPLLSGQAMETSELHVLGPDGKEVPAQFRVLARYWRGDKSIRWVLVDFIAESEEKGRVTYRLVGRKEAAPVPGTAMKVAEDEDFIRVNTGAALFEVSRKAFNVLNRVQIDADLDGQFAENETVVHPDPLLGSVVEDPKGRKYYSSQGTQEVKVLESGPVRVKVMARGVHVSKEEGAFAPGLYGFEVYLTFHAGQPYCNVEAILTNNFAEPIGEPHIRDWSVVTRVGTENSGGWGMDAVTSGNPSAGGGKGESALLYQDSTGTAHWKNCPGVEPRAKDLATFRGYKLWKVGADGTRTEVDAGDFARGGAQCGRSNMGCAIAVRHFWQQFPKAIQYGSGGELRFGAFPREYSSVHWLEDGSAKGYEFQLFFYIKDSKKAYVALNGSRRPWPHVVLDNYLSQPMALPSPEHCGRCGALSDLGPYSADPATFSADYHLERQERRFLMTDDLKGNAFGWQAFGNRWEEMAGHSPWNYEPKVTSTSLFNFLLTRRPNWQEWGLRVSRHARDVRAYLIDDPDLLTKWSKPGAYNRQSIMESFRRKKPELEAHPYRRTSWPLPNHEHLNLDETYDYYLLTGDPRSLRCMQTVAAHGAMSSGLPGNRIRVTRSCGWCFRTLLRYWELTGDARYEPYVKQGVENFWRDINKAGTEGAGAWFLGIYARAVILAWQTTGDERMRDLALGLADWTIAYELSNEGCTYHAKPEPWNLKPEERGERCSWANAYLLDPLAFAWSETGDERYLKAYQLCREKLGSSTRDWYAYMASAQHLVGAPRADRKPPAAVTDLAAAAGEGGAVTLTWTSPGGDGAEGQAAVYQVKHSTKPILEFVPWPEKKDSHVAFWGAENVAGEPAPQAAGAKESFAVKGLTAGKYWFALKSRDAAGNQSGISNVVEFEVK